MSNHSLAEPSSSTEKLLTLIWKDVLALEAVGVYEDFFALGGNSLSGAKLLSRINHNFCIRIPLRNLFDKPTVWAQSMEIERLQNEVMMNAKDIEQLLSKVEMHPENNR